jgi:TM2 domain-containing membrane protein YozV
MLDKASVCQREESLRLLVRELDEEQRKLFYREFNQRVKDPDTHAALNYVIVAGLHHFYLGKWLRGLLNLLIFAIGCILLIVGATVLGLLFIISICLVELYALFNSQVIVQDYNNTLMQTILDEING